MNMEVFGLTVLASLAALSGGYVALRNQSKLSIALGFTAGMILGLVTFDLLPEISDNSYVLRLDFVIPMIALATGFLLFHIIEKTILMHNAHESDYGPHQHPHVGMVGAVALCGHSFLDGVSIGLAFQISHAVGAAVAVAVIGHRFADGFNTTNVMLFHHNKAARAKKMLVIAAVMPMLGGLSTLLFSLSPKVLVIYLGFFAGFLLYIGASDILPQAHSKGSTRPIIGATILGTVFMFVMTRLAGL